MAKLQIDIKKADGLVTTPDPAPSGPAAQAASATAQVTAATPPSAQ